MDGKARKAPKGAAAAKPVTPQQVKKTPIAGKVGKKGAAAALALAKGLKKGKAKERDFTNASIYNLLCLGGVFSVGLAGNKKKGIPEMEKYQFAAAVGEIYMEPVDAIIRSLEALIDDGPVGPGHAKTKGHRVSQKEVDYAIERALGKRLVGATDVEEHRPKHRKEEEDGEGSEDE